MRKYIIICVSLMLLSGCVQNEDNEKLLNQIHEKDDYIVKLEDEILELNNNYKVLKNSNEELKSNNEELKSIVNSKAEIAHNQYFMETRNENVYLKMEIGDVDSGDYTRQLWRYNNLEDPWLLYESKGFSFRVSPNEEVIVIGHNIGDITLINKDGDILFEPDFSEYEDVPEVYGWSDDSKYFWGTICYGPHIEYFFIINTDNWEVRTIKNTVVFGIDRAINTNNGWVCYSDYPICYEQEVYDEFVESKREVKFYLCNIFTEEKININNSITKKFRPKWIDENTLEYDDPLSDKRIKYTLK